MNDPKKPAPTPPEPETTKRPPLKPLPYEAFPSSPGISPGEDILPTDPPDPDPPPPPPPPK